MFAEINLNVVEVIALVGIGLWGGVALFGYICKGNVSTVEDVMTTLAGAPEEDEEDTGEQILALSWLSKTDVIESKITLKVSDDTDDVDWGDGKLTAIGPDDKRIVLTCPPRSALVYCGEPTPTNYEDVEYVLTLKDGNITLAEWKVYSDSDGPDLEGNYWWTTDDDEKTQFMIFAGRELTLIAREA